MEIHPRWGHQSKNHQTCYRGQVSLMQRRPWQPQASLSIFPSWGRWGTWAAASPDIHSTLLAVEKRIAISTSTCKQPLHKHKNVERKTDSYRLVLVGSVMDHVEWHNHTTVYVILLLWRITRLKLWEVHKIKELPWNFQLLVCEAPVQMVKLQPKEHNMSKIGLEEFTAVFLRCMKRFLPF